MQRWRKRAEPWKGTVKTSAAKPPDKNKGIGEEQKKSRPLKQPRRVAAALPAGPSRLDAVEQNLAAARASSSAKTGCQADDLQTVRLRAGRTTDVFLLLLQCGLLRAPADREAVLKPQMGLYAVQEGDPVLILECFTWRGQEHCDVVNMKAKPNANGATHTIDKRSLRTCAAAELVSVGLNFHFLGNQRDCPCFRETISTDPPLLGPSAAALQIQPPCRQEVKQVTINFFQAPLLLQPTRATQHAETHRHSVGVLTNYKFKMVWDIPMPVEVDARDHRCWTCANRRCKIDGDATFFPITPSDVSRAMPEAHAIATDSWRGLTNVEFFPLFFVLPLREKARRFCCATSLNRNDFGCLQTKDRHGIVFVTTRPPVRT